MSYKPSSLFSFPVRTLSSYGLFNTFPDTSQDINSFLFPQNVSSMLPPQFQLENSNSDDENDVNHHDLSLDQKINRFEKEREKKLSEYFSYAPKFQKINLQAAKRMQQIDPECKQNSSYFNILQKAQEKVKKHNDSQFQSKGKSGSLSSESSKGLSDSQYSSRSKTRRWKQPILLNDKNVDLELNTSWIKAASLEADEEYLSWLQDLPNTPQDAKLSNAQNNSSTTSDEVFLLNDPLEEARQNALAKQRELEAEEEIIMNDLPTTEAQFKSTPPKHPVTRIPSAAELSADWGFKDQEIVMSIRKFMLGMQGGLAPDKKKR